MKPTRSAGFEPVHAVSSLLSGLAVPWWITGGWAVDLAVGPVTRDHADVNVMMLERDEHALRGLTGGGRRAASGAGPVAAICGQLPFPGMAARERRWP
jgi:hypothetical protein